MQGTEREQTQPARRPIQAELAPIRDEEFGHAEARHLILRAGFGGTPAQIDTLVSWGPARSVNYLLNPRDVPFRSDDDAPIERGVIPTLSNEQLTARRRVFQSNDNAAIAKIRAAEQRARQDDRKQFAGLRTWWLERMIETPRPLEEKMALFWHGHFASSYRKVRHSWNMYEQNRLFRSAGLGNFGHLLAAIVRDPAMIRYLDNQISNKRSPNENLARELMELFSLGEGAYSERDIKEGARALTGYSFNGDEFRFYPGVHDKGTKRILGMTGNLNGEGFVNAILKRPECATFIVEKLYRFFVALLPEDEPSRAQREVIRRLSSRLRGDGYQLKPMLRSMLLSRHFYSADVMGQRIKSPVELVVGAVRSLGTPVRSLGTLTESLELMGQSLFMPPSVAGWPGGRAWISTSTLFTRQNTMVFLLTGRKPGEEAQTAMMAPKENLPITPQFTPDVELRRLDLAGPDVRSFDPSIVLTAIPEGDRRNPDRAARALLRFTIGIAPAHAVDAVAPLLAARGVEGGMTDALLVVTALPEYQLC